MGTMESICVVGVVLPSSTVCAAKRILNLKLNSIKNLPTEQTHDALESDVVFTRASVGHNAHRPIRVHAERLLLLAIDIHMQ